MRNRFPNMVSTMKKLLVSYDGSEAAKRAIEMTKKCVNVDDEITLLTVIPAELVESSFTKMLLPTIDMAAMAKSGSFKEKAMETLSDVAKDLETYAGKINLAVESGDPADEILLSAKTHDSDVIILGYRGYGKEGRFLLGSVADKVTRYASSSVLIVR